MKKILIVDDESTTRRLVGFVLRTLDVDTVGARDAIEALGMLETDDFDLIMLDVNMPVMDGFEAARQIRRMPAYLQVPIIILTARNHAEDEAQAIEAGANAFLAKPFSTLELRELVCDYLEGRLT
jgi:CheY-like chemotaxis protein